MDQKYWCELCYDDEVAGWKSKPWLCIDTETTGTDPHTARIVQFGAVKMHNGRILQGWPKRQRLNPGIAIPEGASRVHGITDEMVADKPRFSDIASQIAVLFDEETIVVGYNLLAFDWPILCLAFVEAGMDAPTVGALIDPLVHIRRHSIGKYWKGSGRHRLGNVAQRYDIKLPKGWSEHSADADAWLAGRVLWGIRDRLSGNQEHLLTKQKRCVEEQLKERQEWESGGRDAWLAKQS